MDNTFKLKFNSAPLYIASILLFFSPLVRFSWDLAPQTFAHIAVLALILLLLKTDKLFLTPLLYIPCGLLATSSLISFVTNSNAAAVRDSVWVLLSSIALAFASFSADENDRKTLLSAPVLAGFLLSVATLTRPLLAAIGAGADSGGFIEFIVNNNVMAGYLLLAFPLSFIYWNREGFAGQIVSVAMFSAILVTGSRTAALAAVIALVIYLFKYYQNSKSHVFLAALAALAGVIFVVGGKHGFHQSLLDRIMWWRTALAVFFDRPFNGAGWGNFGDIFLAYRVAPGLNSAYAHNIFLQSAAEAGIPAVLSLVLLLLAFASSTVKMHIGEADSYKLPAALSVAGFFFFNLFDYGFYIPSLMYLFFVVLGLCFDRGQTPIRSSNLNRYFYFAVFIVAAFFLVRPLIANFLYSRSVNDFNRDNYADAQKYAESSLAYDGLSWKAQTRLAQIRFAKFEHNGDIGDLKAAATSQEGAVKLFPASARLNSDLAWLYLDLKDYPRALSAMRAAAKYDKYNPRYTSCLLVIEDKKRIKP